MSTALSRRGPQSSLEWLWNSVVIAATTLAFASFILADVYKGGLGTSNGRMVSFLNSLNSVASYRRQRRVLVYGANASTSPASERRRSEVLYVRSPRNCLAHRLKLFSLNFLAKFGSQSLGSVMIGATPVILRGPRHMASWFLAFACIQLCPRDSVYLKLQNHASLLLVVRVGCALYKLRKFNALFELKGESSFSRMLAAQIVVIDGNNLCSRVWTWAWLRGFSNTAPADLLAGLAALASRVAPIAAATFVVARARYQTLSLLSFALKLLVFAVFLWRYDVPRLAYKTANQFGNFRRDVSARAAAVVRKPSSPPLGRQQHHPRTTTLSTSMADKLTLQITPFNARAKSD